VSSGTEMSVGHTGEEMWHSAMSLRSNSAAGHRVGPWFCAFQRAQRTCRGHTRRARSGVE
jgi:hypothetical protein